MLAELALTPDIFDEASYASPGVRDVHLSQLRRILLEEALVRDLRDGDWRGYVRDERHPWHQVAKQLTTKLIEQNRLRRAQGELSTTPAEDMDWAREALASHQTEPLDGVISSKVVKAAFAGETLVADIERLSGASWWQNRSCSVRLERSVSEYRRHLRLVLAQANLLMFIDPHLDPERQGYAEFATLLKGAARQECPPRIEIHRVCYVGSGRNREVKTNGEWKRIFRSAFDEPLKQANLGAQVFIWSDFHDRYLITDIIGILMGNGFDVGPNERTTWTRLSRRDVDDVLREFQPHPESGSNLDPKQRICHHQFPIGLQAAAHTANS